MWDPLTWVSQVGPTLDPRDTATWVPNVGPTVCGPHQTRSPAISRPLGRPCRRSKTVFFRFVPIPGHVTAHVRLVDDGPRSRSHKWTPSWDPWDPAMWVPHLGPNMDQWDPQVGPNICVPTEPIISGTHRTFLNKRQTLFKVFSWWPISLGPWVPQWILLVEATLAGPICGFTYPRII